MNNPVIPSNLPLDTTVVVAIVDRFTVAFPLHWVAEIKRISRHSLLDLPFYSTLTLGVSHQGGKVIPLISTRRIIGGSEVSLPEKAIAIVTNGNAGILSNTGWVVERAIGQKKFSDISIDENTIVITEKLVPKDLWQPQRWQ
jgi:chemotaxis signal transduction protein